MTLYLILLVGAFATWFIAGNNPRRQNIGMLILLLAMMLMCGFRGLYCGTDNLNYQRIMEEGNREFKVEILFQLIITSFRDFNLFMLTFAAMTYIPLYFIIKKETNYGVLAMIIFMISTTKFFPETFNIIRQTMAATLMLGAFVEWKYSNRLPALGLILIATMFHASSLIAVPFLFLKRWKCSEWLAFTLLGISFLIGSAGILSGVIRLVTLGLSLIWGNGDLTNEMARYAVYGFTGTGFNFNAMFTQTFPITIMAILCYPYTEDAKKDYGFYYNIFVIATVMGNIVIPAMRWGFRLSFALQYVQLLVLPMAYAHATKLKKQFLIIYLCILALLYVWYLNSLTRGTVLRPIVPYETWL